MTRGMYAAAGGMLVGMRAADVYASNLANTSTNGYKADRISYGAFQRVALPGVKDGSGAVASINQSPTMNALTLDVSQGALQETGNPLDVAVAADPNLKGSGFLAVQTADGTRYTRNGHLAVNNTGQLVNSDGYPVLGTNGGPITVGRGDVVIRTNGEVLSDNRNVGQLQLVRLTDPTSALKEGGSLIAGGAPVADTTSQIRQGMLESSNADPMRTMIEMIQTLRLVEMNQRVIQAQDSTLQQTIEVAKK